MGVYLNRIGTVKYSHNWPVKGSPPGNPEEDAYIKKEVILHKSLFFFFLIISPSFPPLRLRVRVAVPPPVRSVSASLGRRLSDHLDAVLLELRSKQRILILQLFNLKNKKKPKKNLINNIFIPVTA